MESEIVKPSPLAVLMLGKLCLSRSSRYLRVKHEDQMVLAALRLEYGGHLSYQHWRLWGDELKDLLIKVSAQGLPDNPLGWKVAIVLSSYGCRDGGRLVAAEAFRLFRT